MADTFTRDEADQFAAWLDTLTVTQVGKLWRFVCDYYGYRLALDAHEVNRLPDGWWLHVA